MFVFIIINRNLDEVLTNKTKIMNLEIILKSTKLIKNPNTKTTYLTEEFKREVITEKQYSNITSDDTIKFFRRLGGTESVTRGYTCAGYKIVRVISTSPDKQRKTIYEFEFNYKNQ